MSLLQNCTPILLFSKYNTNLKFRASTTIAWGCMKLKLRLSCNPELFWYKVIKTCRRIQQRYTSWNLFVYIFTLSVCKICILPSEKKNRRKIVKLHMYSHSITRPCPILNWLLSPISLTASFCKQCVKQLNSQICSKNIMRHGFVYLSFTK